MAEAAALQPTWSQMSVDQKAAFLHHVARRLEGLGDIAGAETARVWADSILEKETGIRPNSQRVEPVSELPPRQMIQRLWEVAEWAGEAGQGRYLSAGLLRDGCNYLARVVEEERKHRREGYER